MTFTSAEVALLRSRVLGFGVLVELDYPDGVVRAWSGSGMLTTKDDRVWKGVGGFGAIGEVTGEAGLSANPVTMELRSHLDSDSGVIEAPRFREAVVEAMQRDVAGRAARIYAQVFDLDMTPVGTPVARWTGRMSKPRAGMDGTGRSAMHMQAEGPWVEGRKPPARYLTHVDQQQCHPGDQILEYVSRVPQRVVTWTS